MTRSTIVSAISLVFLGLHFASCDSEPVDPALFNTQQTNTCAAPPSFEASDFIAGSSVNLTWSAAAGTGSWQIQYGPAGFAVGSGTQVVSTSTQATVNGLNSSNNYEFYIRTVCDATTFSGWVGPIPVGGEIGSCAQPANVVATRSAGNTEITVTWDAAGASAWQVQYGAAGFALGSGTTVSTTTPTRTLTGVLANQGYSFYVRANCSGTSNSNWTGPITVNPVGTNPGPGPGPVTYGFLNATVDGVAYTGLKPYFFPFTGTAAKLETLSDNQGRVLWIQGNSTPTASPPNGIEINIRIHENFWQPGAAQTLTSHDAIIWPGISVNHIDLSNDSPTLVSENDETGTITILEFNATTRRIRGTFSYSFMKSGDTVTGPFQVTSGTFDFEVPAEAF